LREKLYDTFESGVGEMRGAENAGTLPEGSIRYDSITGRYKRINLENLPVEANQSRQIAGSNQVCESEDIVGRQHKASIKLCTN
jgi:hypothetical protein